MSLSLHSVKEINLVVQQIGQQKTKMAEILDLDKATTEIIEVRGLPHFS
jgi:hypothetical protein